MRPTLRSIARKADLDISTVSRILNHPEQARVSEQTRQRVHAIARKAGYQANMAAQSLARGKTGCIGVLIPDVTDIILPFYLEEILRLLAKRGLQGIPFPTGWRAADELSALEALSRQQVDGIINLHVHRENLPEYLRLTALGYPMVFAVYDDSIDDLPFNCVAYDISTGYEVLIRHLASKGYRRIGVVGGFVADALVADDRSNFGVQFIRRAYDTLRQAVDLPQGIACPQNTPDEACLAVYQAFKDQPGRFDALIVQSCKLLLGVRKALGLLNLRIPGDVGLAVMDESHVARLMDVPVTVWQQPGQQFTQSLVQLLCQANDKGGDITKVKWRSKLICRESTRGKNV